MHKTTAYLDAALESYGLFAQESKDSPAQENGILGSAIGGGLDLFGSLFHHGVKYIISDEPIKPLK